MRIKKIFMNIFISGMRILILFEPYIDRHDPEVPSQALEGAGRTVVQHGELVGGDEREAEGIDQRLVGDQEEEGEITPFGGELVLKEFGEDQDTGPDSLADGVIREVEYADGAVELAGDHVYAALRDNEFGVILGVGDLDVQDIVGEARVVEVLEDIQA